MIYIIVGDNGVGKSGLLAWMGEEAIFNEERNYAMREYILRMRKNGFNLTVPKFAVSSNIEMKFFKPFCFERKPRIIDPFRLGIQSQAPAGVKCHFTLPYETILIDEAQKYFYSKGGTLPTYRTNFFEQNRHWNLNIYMTTPSPMLIIKDIRQLAYIRHVLKREVRFNRKTFGFETVWEYNEIPPGEGRYELYANCKPSERDKYSEHKTEVCPYNVFDFYDPFGNGYKFIEGHLDDDFDLIYSNRPPITYADFKEHERFMKGDI